MLTFLRKIRKSLIESSPTVVSTKVGGNARKYLLYAIGEIALVVIGILIALQINNWNQDRIDRNRAIEYHQRLIEDLNFIIERNEANYDRAMNVMNSITEAIEILEKGRIQSDEEQKMIDYAMVSFDRLSTQISYLSTWEEMKSSGDMNLIYDIELRKNVEELQGYINLAHEIFNKHAQAIRNDLSVYSKYARTFVDNETLEATVVSDFKAMAADPQFINQFSTNISSWRSQAYFSKSTAESATKLKEKIQRELESY